MEKSNRIAKIYKKWAKKEALCAGVCAAISATLYTLYFSGALDKTPEDYRRLALFTAAPLAGGVIMFGVESALDYGRYKLTKE